MRGNGFSPLPGRHPLSGAPVGAIGREPSPGHSAIPEARTVAVSGNAGAPDAQHGGEEGTCWRSSRLPPSTDVGIQRRDSEVATLPRRLATSSLPFGAGLPPRGPRVRGAFRCGRCASPELRAMTAAFPGEPAGVEDACIAARPHGGRLYGRRVGAPERGDGPQRGAFSRLRPWHQGRAVPRRKRLPRTGREHVRFARAS